MSNILDKFFGPRELNRGLVREALKGATDVMIHRTGREVRVTVHKRGQRADSPLNSVAQAEIVRADREGALTELLPRVGRNSANIRRRSR